MLAVVALGERGRDGDGGNDWPDQAGVFGGSQADPPDRSRAEAFAENGAPGDAGGVDRVSLRATGSAAPAGAFVGWLDGLPEANSKRPARERLTARRLLERLRAEGYRGAYDSVPRHVRAWRRAQSPPGAVFIPRWFAPGEAYQLDGSHEGVVPGGVTTTVKIAHIRLCHSRMFPVRAYPRETQEMVFAAHDHAFRLFGGACRRGIYDNPSTTVDAVFLGRERRFNRRFWRMCSHDLADPVACTPASGWEKGQSLPRRRPGARTRACPGAGRGREPEPVPAQAGVENQSLPGRRPGARTRACPGAGRVGNAREHLFTPRLHFAGGACPRAARGADPWAELDAWLEARCLARSA
jgi:hypothetical protein